MASHEQNEELLLNIVNQLANQTAVMKTLFELVAEIAEKTLNSSTADILRKSDVVYGKAFEEMKKTILDELSPDTDGSAS